MQIKEFAEKFGVSARTIRFYEEKGLLNPIKQENNQYRVFSENEVWRLQTIISLREIGLSLKEIKQTMEHIATGNQDELLYYLELHRAAIFLQWTGLRENINTADQMIALLKSNEQLAPEAIYKLADSSRKYREIRKKRASYCNFDQQALYYDARVRNPATLQAVHPNYEEALELTVKWVLPKIGECGLDVGVGTGNLAGKFLAQGIVISGIDGSKEMLKECKRKFPQLNTKFGNFLALPYLDKEFDFVVTSFAFHYLTAEQKPLALKEMLRVMKPGGRICITDFMFETAEQREIHLNQMRESKETKERQLEVECYADRSKIIDWFEKHGLKLNYQKYNDLLHIVIAKGEV